MHSLSCAHCQPNPTSSRKVRLLWTALILIVSFAAVELAVGLASQSLALVAESGHMISDGVALGLSLVATWLSQLPASPQATFGYRRAEILAALVNGVGLIILGGWIAWEAIDHLQAPPVEILGGPMLLTAIVGLSINSLNAFLLHGDSQHDLNLQGAFLHMLADAVSSVGVIIAAILVQTLHWYWADGAMSLAIGGLIAVAAFPLVRQSLNILLEKTPAHLDVEAIQQHLEGFDSILSVSQLRLWTIAPGQEALSAHLITDLQDGMKRDRLLHDIQTSLQQNFNITEVFLQLTAPSLVIDLSIPPRIEWVSAIVSDTSSKEI